MAGSDEPVTGGLVGRAADRAALAAALDGAVGMVLVDGEAGIGKTALVLAVAAERGLPSVRVAAHEGRAGGFDLLLRLSRQLAGDPGAGLPPGADEEALAVGVAAELVGRAAGRGLLVLLDDLQWADEGTLAVLPHLAELVAGTPVVIVGAYRREEIGRSHAVRPARARLRRTGVVRALTVGELPDEDLRRLVLREAPDLDAAAVEDVVTRADGVPFFAVELATAVAAGRASPARTAPMPETVRDAIALRVAPLDAGARRLLEVAAVIGVQVPFALLDGVRDPEPAATLDALVDTGLLVADDAGVRFRHALLREAVYASVAGHRRRELHRQVARLIEAASGPPLEVARHAEAARDADLARRALLAAAEEDLRVHAYRDAARILSDALGWWPDAERDSAARLAVLDRLAGCLEQTGRPADALALLTDLATERRARGDRPGEAALQQRIARAAEQVGLWSEALRAREEAAVLFSALDRPSSAAAERLAAGMQLRTSGSFTAALSVLVAARADAVRAADPGLLAQVDALYGNVLTRTGAAGGVAHVERALQLALDHGLPSVAAEVYHRLGDTLEQRADYRGAQEAYAAAVDHCDEPGLHATRQMCRACAGYVFFQQGHWDRAATIGRAVLADEDSGTHARAAAAAVSGLVLALRGQSERARPVLLSGAAWAETGRVLGARILAAWGTAVLAEDRTPDDDASIASARALLAVATGTDESHYAIPSLQWAVVTFARHGCLTEARRATARLAAIAETVGHGEAHAAWAHAQAEVAWLEHDAEAAASAARRAIGHAEGLGVAYSCALLASRAGEILVRTGAAGTGLAVLRSARSAARHLRARPLLHRIDAALGDRATAADPRSVPTLTEREIEVMTLVAGGHTSKQIASRLFLSPRTVDMHVRNSMMKLDCRTRTQAATRFLAEPPVS